MMARRKKPGPKPVDAIAINLRLPRGLHAKLTELAATNSPQHSLNYEIVERLTRSVTGSNLAAKYENAEASWNLMMQEMRQHYEQQNAELAKRIAELEAKVKQ